MVTLVEETIEDRIIRMYTKDKKTIFQVAMELGVSEKRVSKIVEPVKRIRNIDAMIPDEKIIKLRDEGLTHAEMAKELNVSPKSVGRKLKKLGLTRPIVHENKNTPKYSFLYRLYVSERKSIKELAEYFGVSQTVVKEWLEKLEVVRTKSAVTLEAKVAMYQRYLALNKERGIPSREELYIFYTKRGWVAEDLAVEYGVTGRTLRGWLERREVYRYTEMDVEDTYPFAPVRYIPEISFQEYAEMMDIKYGTLRRYFAEAREELKRLGELDNE